VGRTCEWRNWLGGEILKSSHFLVNHPNSQIVSDLGLNLGAAICNANVSFRLLIRPVPAVETPSTCNPQFHNQSSQAACTIATMQQSRNREWLVATAGNNEIIIRSVPRSAQATELES
jgi:hypothetical protein